MMCCGAFSQTGWRGRLLSSRTIGMNRDTHEQPGAVSDARRMHLSCTSVSSNGTQPLARPAQIDRIMEEQENETTLFGRKIQALGETKPQPLARNVTSMMADVDLAADSRSSAPAQRQPEGAGDPSLWRVPTQRAMRMASTSWFQTGLHGADDLCLGRSP